MIQKGLEGQATPWQKFERLVVPRSYLCRGLQPPGAVFVYCKPGGPSSRQVQALVRSRIGGRLRPEPSESILPPLTSGMMVRGRQSFGYHKGGPIGLACGYSYALDTPVVACAPLGWTKQGTRIAKPPIAGLGGVGCKSTHREGHESEMSLGAPVLLEGV